MEHNPEDEFIAGSLRKNDTEEIRVSASSFGGYRRAQIRQYRTRENGQALIEPVATIKGVMVEIDQLPTLISLLEMLHKSECATVLADGKAVAS